MRVYIAAPFFNAPQISLVEFLEKAIEKSGHEYYSPRLHSGSDRLTAEEKKSPENWNSVFRSNIEEIEKCTVVLAVQDYLLPEGHRAVIVDVGPKNDVYIIPGGIEMPDTGVVFEMGYAFAIGKPVLAFYSRTPKKVNLMLSHSTQSTLYTEIGVALWLSMDNPEQYDNHGAIATVAEVI